jgi:hypothetical protein
VSQGRLEELAGDILRLGELLGRDVAVLRRMPTSPENDHMTDVYARGKNAQQARELWLRREDYMSSLRAQRERLLVDISVSSDEYEARLEERTREHVFELRSLFSKLRAEFDELSINDGVPRTTEVALVSDYLAERNNELNRYLRDIHTLQQSISRGGEREKERALFLTHEHFVIVVQVASYLGTAAVGGIVGNRADAVLTAAARKIFKRLAARKSRPSLSMEEAIEAAQAAAISQGLSPHADLAEARQDAGGAWHVLLVGTHPMSFLRVRIPDGDLTTATIVITVEPPSS